MQSDDTIEATESLRPRKRTTSDIPNCLRWDVWQRDNFTCQHCGARRYLSIDHVIPYSAGGQATIDNLQTLCRRCNSKKHAKPNPPGKPSAATPAPFSRDLPLFTVPYCARYLRITVEEVTALIQCGELRSYLIGGETMIERIDVLEWEFHRDQARFMQRIGAA